MLPPGREEFRCTRARVREAFSAVGLPSPGLCRAFVILREGVGSAGTRWACLSARPGLSGSLSQERWGDSERALP